MKSVVTNLLTAHTVSLMARPRTVFLLTLFAAGCSSRTVNLAKSLKLVDGGTKVDASQPLDAQLADAAKDAAPPFVVSEAGVTLCGAVPCLCSNGKDDDLDGLSDGFDPECTGAFDDDESSFATGVHGEDKDARCQDCYFDGNSGPGDDGCRRASSCALDGTASGGSGACGTCTPSMQCTDTCLPHTPNGCDCFGCCDVQTPQGKVSVLLRDTCSIDLIQDRAACPRCIQALDCKNECGRCELCPGQTLTDLPLDCKGSDGLGYTCDSGQVCGASVPCGITSYCVQGCCTPILI